MAKTYNTFTNVSTGDVYTAASHNAILQNLAGYRVPPMCRAVRTTTETGYGGAFKTISWNAADAWDTDDMHDPSTNPDRITFNTPGIYSVTLSVIFDYTGSPTYFDARIKGNGSTAIAEDYRTVTGSSYVATITAVVNSATYSYVNADAVIAGGGTTGTFRGDAAQAWFAATWLGQVS